MKTRILEQNRKGSILALAVVMVILLAIVGAGLITLGKNARVYSARTVADISSRLCADAGLTRCIGIMESKLRTNPADLLNSALPSAANVSLDGSYGTYSYSAAFFDPANKTLSKGFLLTSTGKSSVAERNVYARIAARSTWKNAVSVKEGITIKSGATFDTWPTIGGTITMQTNASEGSEGQIIINNNVTIPGDVIIGPGGNIEDVIPKNQDSITGNTYASIEEMQFPSVTPPSGLPLIPTTITNSTTISTSGQYPGINLGNGKTLTIQGNVVMYVTGNIVLNNSASIIINNGSTLTLYLGGNMEDKNSAGVEFLSTLPPDATGFQLYGLDTCESIVLKAKSDFAGSIYAPNADIDLKNGGNVYGAISGESLILRNSCEFFYDTRLGDLTYPPVMYFAVERWWED